MVKIGMVINDRYEIIEKIGTGGMSDVYKALDTKLNRNVAVKVLKQEFGDNENFVSKFRVEAQAAAGLMHSNIVNVYDVGEESGIHYIVMELVEGITLKKYIEKKARLTYKEAVSIAIQVSLGIEAAHANHIIHRDIKPQNIIISRDGKVKVTDFGIAKAASSNTITSNVMGSVHYTSPEQARGGYSDEKSDIYSLGISMFEMLTGRVPFNGDTTVAIAIKHIQEPMPSPREYVPEIPQCVESIIYKCTEKSPDRRYQSMAEVIADLKQALLTPDVDFVDRQSVVAMGGTRVVSEDEMAQIKNTRMGQTGNIPQDDEHLMTLASSAAATAAVAGKNDANLEALGEENYSGYEEAGAYEENPEGYYQDEFSDNYNGEYPEGEYPEGDYQEGDYPEEYEDEAYAGGYYSDDAEAYEDGGSGLEDEEDYNPKAEKVTTIIAIAAGVIIVALIVILLINFINGVFSSSSDTNSAGNGNTSPVIAEEEDKEEEKAATEVTIPTLIGEDVDEIRNVLYGLGLTPSVTYETSDTVETNKIISASVKAGDVVASGTTVELVASSGTGGIELPSVVGSTYESAYNALTKAGFNVSKTEEYSDTVAEGYVISQNPEAAEDIPSGTQVVLTVSKGVAPIKVPNLVGYTEEEAVIKITEAGLKVGATSTVNSENYGAGLVCGQSIESDTYVEAGSTIDLIVSLGTAVKTYKYEANITAPTTDEEPLYTSGTSVKVVIATDDGKELLNTTTSSFPITGTYYGLSTSSGTISLTFTVKVVDVTTTNEDGTTSTSKELQSVDEERTITRKVTFVEE